MSRHSVVSGMKTLGLKVIVRPRPSSLSRRACSNRGARFTGTIEVVDGQLSIRKRVTHSDQESNSGRWTVAHPVDGGRWPVGLTDGIVTRGLLNGGLRSVRWPVGCAGAQRDCRSRSVRVFRPRLEAVENVRPGTSLVSVHRLGSPTTRVLREARSELPAQLPYPAALPILGFVLYTSPCPTLTPARRSDQRDSFFEFQAV